LPSIEAMRSWTPMCGVPVVPSAFLISGQSLPIVEQIDAASDVP